MRELAGRPGGRGWGPRVALQAGVLALAGLGAGLLLLLVWAPGGLPGVGRLLSDSRPAFAASVITGTVVWKENELPAPGVVIVAKDPKDGTVVGQTVTDAQGAFMMAAAVGSWIIEVPSTSAYWGYGQELVAFPHQGYHLDFAITARPPEAPAPTAAPTITPGVTPIASTPTPGGSPAATSTPAPAKLPRSGQPAGPGPAGALILLGCALIALGRRLLPGLRHDRERSI